MKKVKIVKNVTRIKNVKNVFTSMLQVSTYLWVTQYLHNAKV